MKNKTKIALFVCDPKCSVQSSNGVMDALSENYNFKLFSKNEVISYGTGSQPFFSRTPKHKKIEACVPLERFLRVNIVQFYIRPVCISSTP